MLTTRVMFLPLSAIAILLLPAVPQMKDALPEPPCKGIATCNSLGTESLKKGDIPSAISFFKAQVGFSEDAQDKVHSLIAYNNLAVAYLHEGDCLRALSWTHLALRLDPGNKAATFNLQRITEDMKNYKWRTDIGGLYVRYAGRAQWDSIRVSQPKGSTVTFHLLAYRMGLGWRRYGPGSYGDVKGEAALTADGQATYHDPDFETCHIAMSFNDTAVSIGQEGDCGFGYGVQAAGDYERVCSTMDQRCDEDYIP